MQLVLRPILSNPLHKRQRAQVFQGHIDQPGHIRVIRDVPKQFNPAATKLLLPCRIELVRELNEKKARDRHDGLLGRADHQLTIRRNGVNLFVAQANQLVLGLRGNGDAQPQSKEYPGSR